MATLGAVRSLAREKYLSGYKKKCQVVQGYAGFLEFTNYTFSKEIEWDWRSSIILYFFVCVA
jgi:hypothetical protein